MQDDSEVYREFLKVAMSNKHAPFFFLGYLRRDLTDQRLLEAMKSFRDLQDEQDELLVQQAEADVEAWEAGIDRS